MEILLHIKLSHCDKSRCGTGMKYNQVIVSYDMRHKNALDVLTIRILGAEYNPSTML